jgi:hypothetical protein
LVGSEGTIGILEDEEDDDLVPSQVSLIVRRTNEGLPRFKGSEADPSEGSAVQDGNLR